MGGVVEGFTPKVKSLEDPEGEVNPRTRTMTAGNDKYVVNSKAVAGDVCVCVCLQNHLLLPDVQRHHWTRPVQGHYQVSSNWSHVAGM